MEESNYNTEFVSLSLEEGIICITFKKGPITLDIAKELVDKRFDLSGERDLPVLLSDGGAGLTGIDRAAREYMAVGKALEGISASAIFTSSSFNKFLASFFLRISNRKSTFPTKIFSNKDDAIKWLQNFVTKE